MSYNVIQSAGGNSGSANSTATYGTNLSAGTKLIAFASNSGTGGGISSVKDGSGNSFSELTSVGNTGQDVFTVWVLDTLSSQVGTKPTITATAASPANGTALVIVEASGLAPGSTTAACYDGTAGTNGQSGVSGTFTPSFGAYASAVAGELLFAIYEDSGDSGSTATAPGAPYTALAGNQNGNSSDNIVVVWKSSTGGTETAGTWSVTCSSSNGYGTILVAFKLAPSQVETPQYQGGQVWQRRQKLRHYQPPDPPLISNPYPINSRPATTSAFTNPVSTSPGDAILVHCNTAATITGVTDSQGNTYLQLQSDTTHDDFLFAATYHGTPGTPTVPLIAGTDTITVSGSATGIFVVTGIRNAAPYAADKNPAFTSATGTSQTGPATGALTNNNEMVVAWFSGGTAETVTTWGAPFLRIQDGVGGGGATGVGAVQPGSTASLTPTATMASGAANVDGFTAAFFLNPYTPPAVTPSSGVITVEPPVPPQPFGESYIVGGQIDTGAAALTGSGTLAAAGQVSDQPNITVVLPAPPGPFGQSRVLGGQILTDSAAFSGIGSLGAAGTVSILPEPVRAVPPPPPAPFGESQVLGGQILTDSAAFSGVGSLGAAGAFGILPQPIQATPPPPPAPFGETQVLGGQILTDTAAFSGVGTLGASPTLIIPGASLPFTVPAPPPLQGQSHVIGGVFEAGFASFSGTGTFGVLGEVGILPEPLVYTVPPPPPPFGETQIIGGQILTDSAAFSGVGTLGAAGQVGILPEPVQAIPPAPPLPFGETTIYGGQILTDSASFSGSGTLSATGIGGAPATAQALYQIAAEPGPPLSAPQSGIIGGVYEAGFAALSGAGTFGAAGQVGILPQPVTATPAVPPGPEVGSYIVGGQILTDSASFSGQGSFTGAGQIGFLPEPLTARPPLGPPLQGQSEVLGGQILTDTASFSGLGTLGATGTGGLIIVPTENVTATPAVPPPPFGETYIIGGVYVLGAEAFSGTGTLGAAAGVGILPQPLVAQPAVPPAPFGEPLIIGGVYVLGSEAFSGVGSLGAAGQVGILPEPLVVRPPAPPPPTPQVPTVSYVVPHVVPTIVPGAAALSGVGTLNPGLTLILFEAMSGVGTLTATGTVVLTGYPGTVTVTDSRVQTVAIADSVAGTVTISDAPVYKMAIADDLAGEVAVTDAYAGQVEIGNSD